MEKIIEKTEGLLQWLKAQILEKKNKKICDIEDREKWELIHCNTKRVIFVEKFYKKDVFDNNE